MNNEEIAVELAEQKQRTKSNTRRIEGLEKNQDTLNRLVTSVEVIATNMTNMNEKLCKIDAKVEQLEAVPSNKWKNFVGYAISAGVSSIITLLVHKFL